MQIYTTKEALYPTVFCFLFGDHDLTETPPQSQSMTLEYAQFHHACMSAVMPQTQPTTNIPLVTLRVMMKSYDTCLSSQCDLDLPQFNKRYESLQFSHGAFPGFGLC